MPLGANKAAIMGVSGVSTADVVLLGTTTSTGSTLTITGLDSTYNHYVFVGNPMHPATNDVDLLFQVRQAGEASYDNELVSSGHYQANSSGGSEEGPANTTQAYSANATSAIRIASSITNENYSHGSFELILFNPANTTYVTNWMSKGSNVGTGSNEWQASGYFNITGAINAIQFSLTSGDFGAATVKHWGIK